MTKLIRGGIVVNFSRPIAPLLQRDPRRTGV
jgi:hypothetical protein